MTARGRLDRATGPGGAPAKPPRIPGSGLACWRAGSCATAPLVQLADPAAVAISGVENRFM